MTPDFLGVLNLPITYSGYSLHIDNIYLTSLVSLKKV